MAVMMTTQDILDVASAYSDAAGVPETTVSFRVFGTSSKLQMMREGASVTLRRAHDAFEWFAGNWPPDTQMPPPLQAWLVWAARQRKKGAA